MKTILILPMWILSSLLHPFLPRTHPWKSERPTLRSWVEGATETAMAIAFAFWVGVVELVALFIVLGNA